MQSERKTSQAAKLARSARWPWGMSPLVGVPTGKEEILAVPLPSVAVYLVKPWKDSGKYLKSLRDYGFEPDFSHKTDAGVHEIRQAAYIKVRK